jgi:hypothetical protein
MKESGRYEGKGEKKEEKKRRLARTVYVFRNFAKTEKKSKGSIIFAFSLNSLQTFA